MCACLVGDVGSDLGLISTHDWGVEPAVVDSGLETDVGTGARSANLQRRTRLGQADASLGVIYVIRLRNGQADQDFEHHELSV